MDKHAGAEWLPRDTPLANSSNITEQWRQVVAIFVGGVAANAANDVANVVALGVLTVEALSENKPRQTEAC